MSLDICSIGIPAFNLNLIKTNPGFEQDLTDWGSYWATSPGTLPSETKIIDSPVRAGSKALQFGLNSLCYLDRKILVAAGSRYRFGCWAINTASPNYAYIYAKGAIPSEVSLFFASSSSYRENSLTFTATGVNLECGIGIYDVSNSQAVYLDDFFLYKIS